MEKSVPLPDGTNFKTSSSHQTFAKSYSTSDASQDQNLQAMLQGGLENGPLAIEIPNSNNTLPGRKLLQTYFCIGCFSETLIIILNNMCIILKCLNVMRTVQLFCCIEDECSAHQKDLFFQKEVKTWLSLFLFYSLLFYLDATHGIGATKKRTFVMLFEAGIPFSILSLLCLCPLQPLPLLLCSVPVVSTPSLRTVLPPLHLMLIAALLQ